MTKFCIFVDEMYICNKKLFREKNFHNFKIKCGIPQGSVLGPSHH